MTTIPQEDLFEFVQAPIDVPALQEGAKIYKDAGFIKNDIDMTKIATNELIAKL